MKHLSIAEYMEMMMNSAVVLADPELTSDVKQGYWEEVENLFFLSRMAEVEHHNPGETKETDGI